MGHVLGIDLGTTNSVVAIADGSTVRVLANESGARLIPSVVSFAEDGQTLVGEAARDQRLVDAENTIYSIKRLIGRPFSAPEVKRAQHRFAFELKKGGNGGVVVGARGQTYSLTEISAFVLREVKRVAEGALGHACEKAVVTVPANFNELQRSATKAAGRVAGLDVIRIVNEPTAAALAYGFGGRRSERVAVYDLGGGTFDLTLLELEDDVFEVIATAGDSFLGGDDVDLAVAERMADACVKQHRWDPREENQSFERLRAAGEWAKCQLSRTESVVLTVEELGDESPVDLRFELSRKELEAIAQPILARSFDVCVSALKQAELKPGDVDAVILVGGSTRMPVVRSMVEEFFGKPPHVDIDPDLVVAQGAAIHGYAIAGKARPSAPASKPPAPVKPFSVAELRAAQKQRTERKKDAPKQPAFAPTSQYEPALPPGALVGSRRVGPSPKAPPPLAHALVVPIVRVGDEEEVEELELEEVAGDESAPLAFGELPDVPFRPGPALDLDSGLDDLVRPSGAPLAPFGDDDAFPIPDTRPNIPVLEMAERPAPLLMDVTPHSLGIETVSGICQAIIRRNVPIPCEQSRTFTTARDGQTEVVIQVFQGESRVAAENQALGSIELTGLRPAPRGEVRIEVTFVLDSSGILDVRAVDRSTGVEQATRIHLLGGADDRDHDAMRARNEQAMPVAT